jgi:3-methyladenine DNA glycosylase/8-oxoguanine DNA glycosylase
MRDGSRLAFDVSRAVAQLGARDARLARLMEQVGVFAGPALFGPGGAGPGLSRPGGARPDPSRPAGTLRFASTSTTFEALAESIVYQQLTGKAAATIHARVCALFPGARLEPGPLLAASEEALRGAGLSRGKVLAIRDLAARTVAGSIPSVDDLHAMGDEDIVESLVQVRGIGRWTVEMLLIFRLGRPDVLPVHDYGVRHGFKLAYRKRQLPTPKELAKHGEKWRPFRTIASWYLWRAVDLARAAAAPT